MQTFATGLFFLRAEGVGLTAGCLSAVAVDGGSAYARTRRRSKRGELTLADVVDIVLHRHGQFGLARPEFGSRRRV